MNGGTNLYDYCGGMPILMTDPQGLLWGNDAKCERIRKELTGLRDSIKRQVGNLANNITRKGMKEGSEPLLYRTKAVGKCMANYEYARDVEGHLIKLAIDMSTYVGKATNYIIDCNNQGPPPPGILDPLPVPDPVTVRNDPTGPRVPWIPTPPPMPEWEPLLFTGAAGLTAAAIAQFLLDASPCLLLL